MELSQMLFYGGIAAVAIALLLGIASFILLKLRSIRLNKQFDLEYGERKQKNR